MIDVVATDLTDEAAVNEACPLAGVTINDEAGDTNHVSSDREVCCYYG